MNVDTELDLELDCGEFMIGWKAPEIDNTVELNLIVAIKQVVKIVEDSQLCDEALRCASRPLEYVSQKMNLNQNKALLLCLFASKSNYSLNSANIASFFNLDTLDILAYRQDIEGLVEAGFLRKTREFNSVEYWLSREVMDAIARNEGFAHRRCDNLTIEELFNQFGCMYNEIQRSGSSEVADICEDISGLCQKNKHLPFVQRVKSLNLDEIHERAFLYSCHMLVNNDDNVICKRDVREILSSRRGYVRQLWSELARGSSELIKKKLWQPCNEDGIASTDNFELTDYVRSELLQGLGVERKQSKSQALTPHNSISPKEMFYNPQEARALEQLTALLEPEQFILVAKRLKQKGMRLGFTCLFYGTPGTGKTETVLQLARQTGHDIMMVNMASIRSKWVGESEKNIQSIFKCYAHELRRSTTPPILFFNEADAIFSKRNENVAKSVDKMENAIQNIILQELENFEGILIATTNLTKNMDSAFERRFLYKIEFHQPSVKAKCSIWQTMIPSLSEADASMLAARYDFSGGQIENVARKQAVEEALWGGEFSIDRIVEFCNEERLGTSAPQRRIGFIQSTT